MGMSATQARFLCLTARKSNVEFEGQQINQQRTTLSNESANYYSELCSMTVPTPPSVDDYTKVTYTFNDGAMTNTITSMIALTGANAGKYSISYLKQWQDDYAIVPAASSLVSATVDRTTVPITISASIGASKLRPIQTVFNGGAEPDATDVAEFKTNYGTDEYIKTLSDEQIMDLLREEKYYYELLNNEKLNPTSAAKGSEGWMVRYVKDLSTGAYKPSFYPIQEFNDNNKYGTTGDFYSISCFTLGSATQTEQVFDRKGKVEKDTAGRYVSIVLENPDGTEETFALTTNTTTDEEAYNDAMNKYAFDQAQYDKKIQDINAQLEIVQQQDKKLELNLKQLDTEENAINIEMEAVKKVIQKNVESSFKTFNA
ncbi:hypothetical protein IJ596_08820 [bacterium]|nr:hypothetical protein [bacterium]